MNPNHDAYVMAMQLHANAPKNKERAPTNPDDKIVEQRQQQGKKRPFNAPKPRDDHHVERRQGGENIDGNDPA